MRGQITAVNRNMHWMEPLDETVLVGTDERVAEALAINDNVQMMGPYTDREGSTVRVLVHWAMYLPPIFVPLILHQDLTPREAWMRIGGAIVAGGMENHIAQYSIG